MNQGRLRGKQPTLKHRQEAHLVALLKDGQYSTAELADLFGVARSIVYRAVERERVRAIVGVDSTVGSPLFALPYGNTMRDSNALLCGSLFWCLDVDSVQACGA
jgi:hypothetical protein